MSQEGNRSESAEQSSGMHVSAGGNVTTGDHVARDKITHNYYGPPPTPSPSPEDESPAPGLSPFKGLEYFNETDAALFFGREALTAKLVGHLRHASRNFLAVVGASGSGKSSLVRAGLVPALKRGEPLADPTPLRFGDYSGALPPEGSTHWPIHIITPTSHPLEALAASLTRNSESVTATLIDDLARDPRSLHLYVRKILSGPPTHAPSPIGGFPMGEGRGGGRLLLVVDQFEELFTLCRAESERQAFVDNLLTAVAAETDGPTIVVLTLRADFYAHCAQFADLRETLAKQQEYIGPMSADELRRAIEEPAKRGNWNFEEGLVDLLLREVGNEPGALPLLSHALLETWKRRSGHRLTLKGYTDSGGVRGAIAKTAETVYQQLTPEEQTIARSIFLRLTELGEGTQDTRRRAALTELIPRPEDKAAFETVLKTLADARLIMTGEETAEVAHEALIREWPTLRRWLDEDREGLQIHRRLTQAAQSWTESNRDESELYRGGRLSAALEWTEDHAGELNMLEREFLDASRALQVSELEAAVKRAAEQLRANRRLRWLAVGLGMFLLIALVSMLLAIQQSQRAERQARISLAGQLAAQSQAALENYPQRSLLLAIESINSTLRAGEPRAPIAEQALREAFVNTGGQGLSGHQDKIAAVAFSPNNHWLVTGSWDKTALLWDMTAKDPTNAPIVLPYQDWVSTVAFSHDSHWLVTTGGWDKTALLWDMTARDPSVMPIVLRGHEGGINAVAFSPDNRWLVTGSDDRTARLWDMTAKDPASNPIILRGHEDWINAVAFSPNSHWVATTSFDKTARLWDLTTPDPSVNVIVLSGHDWSVNEVAFSPDDHWLVTGSGDATTRLWDMTTKNPAAVSIVLRGHTNSINAVAISPNSHWLVTGSVDQTRFWDLTSPTPSNNPIVMRGHDWSINTIAFSPNGHWLITSSDDNIVHLWDWNLIVKSPAALPIILNGHEGPVQAIAISSDSHWLVTGSEDTTARLWDLKADDPASHLIILHGHDWWPIYAVAFSPDGHWLVAGSEDANNYLWNLTSSDFNTASFTLSDLEDSITETLVINTIDISSDSHWLVTGNGGNIAHLWDLKAKNPSTNPIVLRGHEDWITAVAISLDNHWLVTGSADSTARLWNLTAQDPASMPMILRGHEDSINAVAFSPDGHWLVTGGDDKTARLWNLTTLAHDPSTPPIILRGHEDSIEAVAFSPDNHWLVTGSWDNTAHLWNMKAKDPAATPIVLLGHKDSIRSVAFSPDSHWLVTGSNDETARLWNLNDLAHGSSASTIVLHGHESYILAVAFSPDNHWLATVGGDQAVRLWDLTTRDPNTASLILHGHESFISAVAFSPDNHWLATGSRDGTVRMWDLRLEELVDTACQTAGRNLTREEWNQYLGNMPYHKTCEQWPEGK